MNGSIIFIVVNLNLRSILYQYFDPILGLFVTENKVFEFKELQGTGQPEQQEAVLQAENNIKD